MRPLVGIACTVIILAALKASSDVAVPFLLAATLAIAFQPISSALDKRGLPASITVVTTTVLVLSACAGAGVMIYVAAADLSDKLPHYQARIGSMQHSLAGWLMQHHLAGAAKSVNNFDTTGPLANLLQASLENVGAWLEILVLVLIITAFIQLEAGGYRKKFARVFGTPRPMSKTLASLASVQRYLLVKTIFSLANGVLLGLWCWAWGVPSALLWGFLAFALNYIPVLGSILSSIPPILIAVVEGGPGTALGVAAGYAAVHLFIDNMLETRVMGHALDLSPVVVIMSILVWGFVLGPVGALLSIPLTMAVKLVIEQQRDMKWLAMLMGETAQPSGTTSVMPVIVVPTTATQPSITAIDGSSKPS